MRRTSATIDDPDRGANKADAKAMKIVADILDRANINDTPHRLRLRLSTIDPGRDICGLSPILIATSARTLRRPVPGFACCFLHRRAFGNTIKQRVAGISLIFPTFRASRPPRSRWHRSLGRRREIRWRSRASSTRRSGIMLKSTSRADSRPKGARSVRHAGQVKSLSDRNACVSHPADCGNCER